MFWIWINIAMITAALVAGIIGIDMLTAWRLRKIGARHRAASEPVRRMNMHFKRKRAKNQRSGCLMCKPHKMNGYCERHKRMRHGNRKRYEAATYQMKCE